jgi:hypothetical protein
VRATGANNVVIIGGPNYAYDLSQIPAYAVTGNNIVYNTHPYDFPSKQVFLVIYSNLTKNSLQTGTATLQT